MPRIYEIRKGPKVPDLVVGIDFGMTGTAVSYYYQGITSLVRFNSVVKVPTILLYETINEQEEQLRAWAHEAETIRKNGSFPSTSTNPIYKFREWFKILNCTSYLEVKQRHEVGLTHAKVKKWITDFLRNLYLYIETDFCERHVNWDNMHVVFIFGIPDLWSLEDRAAVESFKNCIENAGFASGHSERDTLQHEVHIQTEAVAAAHFMIGEQPTRSNDGENMLIMDIGGGTLDIALCQAYLHQGVLMVKSVQSICSIVGTCGANYLMKVEECIEKQWLKGDSTRIKAHPWRTIQSHVRSDLRENIVRDHFKWDIPVLLGKIEDDEQAGIKKGFLRLDERELSRCRDQFEVDLLQELINKMGRAMDNQPIKANSVYVAGGFGQDPMVLSAIDKWKRTSTMRSLQLAPIYKSSRPRLEVALGLVRLTAKSYGFVGCSFHVYLRGVCVGELATLTNEDRLDIKTHVKCSKDDELTIRCQNPAHFDAMGEVVNTLNKYDVVVIKPPKLKAWQFSKSRKLIEGYVTPTELVLNCKEVEG